MPVITDDTEVASLGREYLHDLVLEEIGILVLIDHEVGESIVEVFEHLRDIDDSTKEEQ